jgi:hypothetical protein
MKGKAMRIAAYLASALGVVLHVYLTIVDPLAGSLYDIIVPFMDAIPYLVCIIIARSIAKPIMPLCAGLILFMTDIYLFHDYLAATRIHRFVVVEFYQTVFKTVVMVPAGCFIGFLIDKLMRHYTSKTL